MAEKQELQTAARNKKAYHDYFVEDSFEAGIALFGTEIKSVRRGGLNLKDAYCHIDNGQMTVVGMHISPYDFGNRFNVDPDRERVLLMHKKEIYKLFGLTKQQGYTLIPLSAYFRNGRLKIQVGLCRGKKNYDKREAIARKDAEREARRELKTRG